MKRNSLILSICVLLLVLFACTRYDFDQPDTAANQAGFERHFGFHPPDSVTELYYYADEMGTDVLYQMGFETKSETVQRIVTELDLVQGEPDSQNNLARDFEWWNENMIEELIPYWKSTPEQDYYWMLWYDPETQQAYYLEYSL